MADLTSGLTTKIDVNTTPARLFITTIDWMSPFRATDLEVGDEITAIDGEAFDPAVTGTKASRLVGQYAEYQGFDVAGRKAGDIVRLTLRRAGPADGRSVEVCAPLAERRDWRSADNRVLMGPGGPDYLSNDGFVDSWTGWGEKFRQRVDALLDVSRHGSSFDAAAEASAFTAKHGERVVYAVAHYPGAWSAAVAQDYERVLQRLRPPPAPPAATADAAATPAVPPPAARDADTPA